MNEKHRPTPAEQIDHDLSGSPRPEDMQLKPQNELADYHPAGKMAGKVAFVTGGDTGIGHCISLAFAMEDADVAVVHHGPAETAAETARLIMTRSMAMELAPCGVWVNAVVPGPVWTPRIATQPESVVEAFGGFTMLGRAGQPEEIAPAYVYLATADSSFVTGMLMDVSGGFRSADPDA